MWVEGRSVEGNDFVAAKLRETATLLAAQADNPFRVRAFRHAADTVEALERPVAGLLVEGGREALEALPGIGPAIAAAIAELVQTGRLGQLDRMRGALEPERLFQTVPGIGPALARQIHDGLQVDSLEALEAAAHDGRLGALSGLGPRRVAIIRQSLAEVLARCRPRIPHRHQEPEVGELLWVDGRYRQGAEAGTLPTIAPRRFNPEGTTWLPILHVDHGAPPHGPWHFTALYSNSPLAHRLNRVRDWVVIYFTSNSGIEGQRTVVTETHGPAAGRRVVRGREAECLAAMGVETKPSHGAKRQDH